MKISVSGYRWYPSGTTSLYYERPAPGVLVAFDHAVWRVIETRDLPADRWTDEDHDRVRKYGSTERQAPYVTVLRPASIDANDPKARDHDKHYRCRPTVWHVYPDEHFPICNACHEPLPCREQVGREIASNAVKQMDRFSMAGVCPSCEEPVTSRQKTLTFTENLELPGGPPVTYHLRGTCRMGARKYEIRWVAADPARRRATLSCTGHVINHNDGTYECTQLGECPGPTAQHPSYTTCRCPDCHARGEFGCGPAADAKLLRRDPS